VISSLSRFKKGQIHESRTSDRPVGFGGGVDPSRQRRNVTLPRQDVLPVNLTMNLAGNFPGLVFRLGELR
jgi:hypothetical protein